MQQCKVLCLQWAVLIDKHCQYARPFRLAMSNSMVASEPANRLTRLRHGGYIHDECIITHGEKSKIAPASPANRIRANSCSTTAGAYNTGNRKKGWRNAPAVVRRPR
jgi:hypothetical protein